MQRSLTVSTSTKRKNPFGLDFLGIGTPKSGTTWLFNRLKQHPEICTPRFKKELHFFNDADSQGMPQPNRNFQIFGLPWYAKHFQHCKNDAMRGEFTGTYLYSHIAAKRIYELSPNVKLICMLRNPVDRAFSMYQWDKLIGLIDMRMSFSEAIQHKYHYIEHGLYCKYLKRYYEIFPRDNILIAFFEEMTNNPKNLLQRVYSFLGVDHDFVPQSLYQKDNVGGMSRFPKINKNIYRLKYYMRRGNFDLIIRMNDLLGLSIVFPKIVQRKKKTIRTEPIDKEEADLVKDRFLEDICDLELFLNVDLSHWKSY